MAKFKPGQSGNPSGKPEGVKHWYTILRDELRGDAPKLIAALKRKALRGDVEALKFLIAAVLPRTRPTAPPVEIEGMDTATGLADRAEIVMTAVSRGEVPPDIGSQLIAAIGSLGALRELQEVEDRLARLEQQLKREKPKRG